MHDVAHAPLAATDAAHSPVWSTEGFWLTYRINHNATSSRTHHAVNLSGAIPQQATEVPVANIGNSPHWIPGSTSVVTVSELSTMLHVFDVTTPLVEPKLVTQEPTTDVIRGVHVSPAGELFAYRTNSKLGVASVAGGTPTVVNLSGTLSRFTIPQVAWSGDGQFLALTRRTENSTPIRYDAKVLRVQGTATSAPIDLGEATTNSVQIAWQTVR